VFLIHELNLELSDVNQQLSLPGVPKKPKLDSKFFVEVVTPILEKAGNEGIPARELFGAINDVGLVIGYDNLRLFLSRSAKRGVIRQIQMVGRPNRWSLNGKPVNTQASVRGA
jgi:hypothetical protein